VGRSAWEMQPPRLLAEDEKVNHLTHKPLESGRIHKLIFGNCGNGQSNSNCSPCKSFRSAILSDGAAINGIFKSGASAISSHRQLFIHHYLPNAIADPRSLSTISSPCVGISRKASFVENNWRKIVAQIAL
jgi:hypothetical protein